MPALQFLEDIHRLNEDGPTSRALPLLEAAALNYLNGWAVDPASLFIVPSQPHSRSNSRRLKKSCCRSLGPAAPTIFSWWPTIAWRLWRLPTARDCPSRSAAITHSIAHQRVKLGRASGRERVYQYVLIPGGAGSLKK